MLFKRLNREQPEQIFIVVQNTIGSGTAMVANGVAQLDITTAVDGVKAVVPTTAGLWCFLGIIDAAIADQDYGLVQVYGYRSSSILFQTDTTQAAGLPLLPVNAQNYLQTAASTYTFASNTTVSVTLRPYMAMLAASVDSSSASATVSGKIFIRAL
jgi:hypothetical protein